MKTIEASTSRCSKDQDFLQKSYVNKSFFFNKVHFCIGCF